MAFYKETSANEKYFVKLLQQYTHAVTDDASLQPLYDRLKDSKIVMLGEASHGTHEYYTWRTRISKKLIEEHGFSFIAVEGDWPDCYKLNRFAKGYIPEEESPKAVSVLHDFHRWPTWMWANWEVTALGEWLRKHNHNLAADKKAGFYGLDVYSLWESMESIIKYLRETEPDAVKAAEDAFRCFEPYRKDEGQSYARASMFVPKLCQSEVINLLREIQQRTPANETDYENAFSAEQNALVAVNAERYYRAMVEGGGNSWNLRDRHMMDTLDRLLKFYGTGAKAIVWAHNTHIGDARATNMAAEGMFNIGELAREEYGKDNVALVGFGSYGGTVMAGRSWGAQMEVMKVPEARKGSWEYLMHKAGENNKLLIMDNVRHDTTITKKEIGHRAIGVVYNPEYERWGNYVPSILPDRYDAFVYLDQTRALHPLHNEANAPQVPDTYPFGV